VGRISYIPRDEGDYNVKFILLILMMGMYGGFFLHVLYSCRQNVNCEWNDQWLNIKVKSFYSYLYDMIHNTSLSSCLSC